MKTLLFLLSATATFATIFPPDPELDQRPDSVLFYSGNVLEQTNIYKYNNEGYLTQLSIINKEGSAEIPYQYLRNGDTITCNHQSAKAPNNYFEKYLLNNNGLPIKTFYYEANFNYTVDSFSYNPDNKITNIECTYLHPVDPPVKESSTYTYENNHLKSAAILSIEGKTIHIKYENDEFGRLVKAIDSINNASMLCRYSQIPVNSHDNKLVNVKNVFTLNLSNSTIDVSFYNGTVLKSMALYDLGGNRIGKSLNIYNSSGSLNIRGVSSQNYILKMNTSNGSAFEKIFFKTIPEHRIIKR